MMTQLKRQLQTLGVVFHQKHKNCRPFWIRLELYKEKAIKCIMKTPTPLPTEFVSIKDSNWSALILPF
jgi:hypothetical protein